MACTWLWLTDVSAQPPPPGGGEDPFIPIDGGASLLAAAGVAYGAKKLYHFRKNKSTD